jgi:D-alanyl-D-alanine carboxypeptidase (penicillin-binding protein 5/6)
MRARGVVAAAVCAVLVLLGSPAVAKPPPTTADPGPPPLPKAYVLVDADTGNVLASQDARRPVHPASTIKLLTALIAVQRLPAGDAVPISSLAESMPARKMNVKSGQSWTLVDLMHSLLMVSANDSAVAIAERVGGGTVEGWTKIAQQAADRLGLVDHPVLNDPAGLDDQFSQGGGTLISARDLAIVGRAVLARADIMSIIQTPKYEFAGGDGIGHKLTNQDPFLALYPGATGLKTGATEKAGRTFVGSATRDGRTMLVVVFDAIDPLRSAEAFLDQGFATPVASESSIDALPAVVPDAALTPPTTVQQVVSEQAAGTTARTALGRGSNGMTLNSPPVAAAVLLAGLVLLVIVRRTLLVRWHDEDVYRPDR